MHDKLLREKLRVLKDLVGDTHPFIVTEMVVKRGRTVRQIPVDRETPTAYTEVWRAHR